MHTFHSLCDNIGPTVTLVRVKQNVFGGYADKNWNSCKHRIVVSFALISVNVEHSYIIKQL